MVVPQFRDGECEVRRLWDQAVAEAMGWDAAELKRLRLLLHREPHVRGLGYGQYADEVEVDPAVRERFTELADRWYMETCLMSNSDRAAAHPDHMEIISMGEPVVPLILERMQDGRGHWDYALGNITGANPVKRARLGQYRRDPRLLAGMGRSQWIYLNGGKRSQQHSQGWPERAMK